MTNSPQDHALPPGGAAARNHIRRLSAHGATYRAVGRVAGIGATTARDVATSHRPPAPAIAVLRVSPRAVPATRLDAGGTRLRLRALHVMGHGSLRLARAVGVSERTIRSVVSGDARTVSTRLSDAVIAVYDQWWDKRAPERTPAERAAATLSRRRAIRGDWCAGGALDDDLLDIPGYKPSYGWRPASGTGTAHDIARHRRCHLRQRR